MGECAAAVGGGAFAGVVGGLAAGDRRLLEEVVREGGVARRVRDEGGEPAIALKMDFLGASG